MRQLKQFLKAKKGICSNECKCITINMWRCADLQGGDEFCGCGDSGAFVVGNKVYAELFDSATGDWNIRLFTTGKSGKDYISANETSIELVGALDSTGGQALQEVIFNNNYAQLFYVGKGGIFPTTGVVGTIDADAMALVIRVFEDPSEENKQELTSFLQTHMEAVQQGDVNAVLVTYPVAASITFLPKSREVDVGELIEIDALVTPSDENITVASSDPSILRVDSIEKNTETPLNAYIITCTGMASGTATVTATCVNDPSVSVSTPTITVNPGR